jgi:hypothetical protein
MISNLPMRWRFSGCLRSRSRYAVGAEAYNEEAATNHHPNVTAIEYVGTARFWFESFQSWQSEFVSILAMVILSIFLREKGSPESKPVDSSDAAAGE